MLTDWFVKTYRFVPESLRPLYGDDRPQETIEGDIVRYHVGYCGNCSERILVRRTVARALRDLFHKDGL